MHVAVAGMGVSGLALGKALKALGARPVVFDQKPNDSPAVIKAVDELDSAGIQAVTGWHGHLDPQEFELLIVSPGFPRNHPAILDMLAGNREIWSEVEFAYRVAKAPIIAITGTNGKSTTTTLVWALLQASGHQPILCGNIAGSGYPEMPLTQAAHQSTPDQVLVAEISSYQLEWIHEFAPKVAGITNITPDHMDRYKSFEDYFNTKLRIFEFMCKDDKVVANLAEPSLTISTIKGSLDGDVQLLTFDPTGLSVGTAPVARYSNDLQLGPYRIACHDLGLVGEHNITNVMMAWSMASALAPLDGRSVEALKTFKELNNRLEIMGVKDGVMVINNSMCTNPAAVISSMRAFAKPQHILMGGLTKNLDFTPVGKFLENSEHKVYIYGPKPELMNEMLGGIWPIFETLEESLRAAIQNATPESIIMLAPGCASAEPYANFKERGQAFKAMVMRWFEEKV